MDKIVIDAALQAKLEEAVDPVEMRDSSGRLLGHFVPSLAPREGDILEPDISEEELDRREAAGPGRPLKAILADLERLG